MATKAKGMLSCVAAPLQVIANTGGVLGMGGTPHEVLPRAGKSIVDVDQVPFKGPKTPKAKWHKVCRHTYCRWSLPASSGMHRRESANLGVVYTSVV